MISRASPYFATPSSHCLRAMAFLPSAIRRSASACSSAGLFWTFSEGGCVSPVVWSAEATFSAGGGRSDLQVSILSTNASYLYSH